MDVQVDSLKGKWYVSLVGSNGDGTDYAYMRVDGTFAEKMNAPQYNGAITEGDGYYFESAVAASTAATVHGHNVARICPQED